MTNTNTNIAADLYNFADTAGVPDDVAAAVNKERKSGLNEALYDAVVNVVIGSPKPITIKQVIFVLHKLVAAGKLDKVPAENTVRSYLNAARDDKNIGKPSRQSYWNPESDVEDAEGDANEEADAATDDVANVADEAATGEPADELGDDADPLA